MVMHATSRRLRPLLLASILTQIPSFQTRPAHCATPNCRVAPSSGGATPGIKASRRRLTSRGWRIGSSRGSDDGREGVVADGEADERVEGERTDSAGNGEPKSLRRGKNNSFRAARQLWRNLKAGCPMLFAPSANEAAPERKAAPINVAVVEMDGGRSMFEVNTLTEVTDIRTMFMSRKELPCETKRVHLFREGAEHALPEETELGELLSAETKALLAQSDVGEEAKAASLNSDEEHPCSAARSEQDSSLHTEQPDAEPAGSKQAESEVLVERKEDTQAHLQLFALTEDRVHFEGDFLKPAREAAEALFARSSFRLHGVLSEARQSVPLVFAAVEFPVANPDIFSRLRGVKTDDRSHYRTTHDNGAGWGEAKGMALFYRDDTGLSVKSCVTLQMVYIAAGEEEHWFVPHGFSDEEFRLWNGEEEGGSAEEDFSEKGETPRDSEKLASTASREGGGSAREGDEVVGEEKLGKAKPLARVFPPIALERTAQLIHTLTLAFADSSQARYYSNGADEGRFVSTSVVGLRNQPGPSFYEESLRKEVMSVQKELAEASLMLKLATEEGSMDLAARPVSPTEGVEDAISARKKEDLAMRVAMLGEKLRDAASRRRAAEKIAEAAQPYQRSPVSLEHALEHFEKARKSEKVGVHFRSWGELNALLGDKIARSAADVRTVLRGRVDGMFYKHVM